MESETASTKPRYTLEGLLSQMTEETRHEATDCGPDVGLEILSPYIPEAPDEPKGGLPARSGGEIYLSLRWHERKNGGGFAFPAAVGFAINALRRYFVSPDAAWYVGPKPDMRFPNGAPAFAAEIRSENDYGPLAEQEMADKRADYFAAGTQVVWDVDLLGEDVVRKYSTSDPASPTIFRCGDMTDAEPAVPGWTMPVDDLFL